MNIFRASNRTEWRLWLKNHHETTSEVWFVFPTRSSGERGVSYNDAVEEALCFGWIDSTNKKLDATHNIRRFSPRKKGSAYSQPNIERLKWLNEQGMLSESVKDDVAELLSSPFEFPSDIIAALQKDDVVWKNYQGFSESYKRIRIAYIDAARKRPEEFAKRLRNFIDKTRAGKLIMGYGGVDKYYR